MAVYSQALRRWSRYVQTHGMAVGCEMNKGLSKSSFVRPSGSIEEGQDSRDGERMVRDTGRSKRRDPPVMNSTAIVLKHMFSAEPPCVTARAGDRRFGRSSARHSRQTRHPKPIDCGKHHARSSVPGGPGQTTAGIQPIKPCRKPRAMPSFGHPHYILSG